MVTDLVQRIHGVVIEDPDKDAEDHALVLQNLPAALGIVEHASIKPCAPFLSPQPQHLERWRKAFADLPRPLIGVDWEQFAPGVAAAGVIPVAAQAGTVVSLAGDPKRRRLADWPNVIDAGAHIQRADDLVAAVACLDAFVGPDGLPLHVAGALGIPGVALIACGPPWYFAADGDRLIWYRSLVAARQALPGHWDDALAKAADSLGGLVSTPSPADETA